MATMAKATEMIAVAAAAPVGQHRVLAQLTWLVAGKAAEVARQAVTLARAATAESAAVAAVATGAPGAAAAGAAAAAVAVATGAPDAAPPGRAVAAPPPVLATLASCASIADAWGRYDVGGGAGGGAPLYRALEEARGTRWRPGMTRTWSEWTAYAAYVGGPGGVARERPRAPGRGRRGDGVDGREGGAGAGRVAPGGRGAGGRPAPPLSVTAYIMRLGVAPFFGQRPVIPHGAAEPRALPAAFAACASVRADRCQEVRRLRGEDVE